MIKSLGLYQMYAHYVLCAKYCQLYYIPWQDDWFTWPSSTILGRWVILPQNRQCSLLSHYISLCSNFSRGNQRNDWCMVVLLPFDLYDVLSVILIATNLIFDWRICSFQNLEEFWLNFIFIWHFLCDDLQQYIINTRYISSTLIDGYMLIHFTLLLFAFC